MGNKIFQIICIILVILSTTLFFGCTSQNQNYTQSQLTPAEIKSTAIEISYDNLFRNNESYVGKIVLFKGAKILQVVDDSSFRVSVNTDELYSQNIIYLDGYAGGRLLENDLVDIYGRVNELVTYKAVLGNNVTIPSIKALIVERTGTETLADSIKKQSQVITQNLVNANTQTTKPDENKLAYAQNISFENTEVVNDFDEYTKSILSSSLKSYYKESDFEKYPYFNSKLRNKGDKTVTALKLTIYFLGKDNTRISEKTFDIIGGLVYTVSDNPPLRPNYVKEVSIRLDTYAPSDWGNKVEYAITSITTE